MTKKHFMCTHTWATPEARQPPLTMTQGMTDRQFFEALKQTEQKRYSTGWVQKIFLLPLVH
jgi:hypothetical protein